MTHASKWSDDFSGQHSNAAVTTGCGDECPLVVAARREDWLIPDPKELPAEQFNLIHDPIEWKVKEFLATLSLIARR